MKTIQDVAKSFKKAAGKAIYPGVSYTSYKTGTSKAFKTGNLLSKFVTSPQNQPNRIARQLFSGPNGISYTLVLEVAPQGAEYGAYVHYGTSKMGERPFAELGANDNTFNQTLNEFLSDKIDVVVDGYIGQMDSNFKEAGFTVS